MPPLDRKTAETSAFSFLTRNVLHESNHCTLLGLQFF
uniref:Uncharacterized protein n=1 Tax=Anguilla anguilla TaxID=7936 RepID=A0A0E9SFW2_ANGAN